MGRGKGSLVFPFLAVVLPSLRRCSVYGKAVNITVDDQATDPNTGQSVILYSDHLSVGQDCGSSCASAPNPSQAYDQTWHDTTYDPERTDYHTTPQTATFHFNGA